MAINEDCFLPQSCVTIYTDGSASAATKDGGAGVLINHHPKYRDSVCTCGTTLHKLQSRGGGKITGNNTEDAPEYRSKVEILTDALSVLQAFINSKLSDMTRALQKISQTRAVRFQWIPANCHWLEMKGHTFWPSLWPLKNSPRT